MDDNLRLFVRERLELCDLLAGLSDEEWHAATLDEGWTVEDLAAHIVVRERRTPELARALLLRGRGGSVDDLMAREKSRGHAALIAALRTMPLLPFRLPGLSARGNLCEAYIHHEDVRRGALDRPRIISDELQQALWVAMPLFDRLSLRRVPVKGMLVIEWPERARRAAAVGAWRVSRAATADATLSGEPGELLLWLSGRKDAARVQLTGQSEMVPALRETRMDA